MTDQIYEQALALLGGNCDNEQALKIACEAAYQEFAGRLRKKITPEDIQDVFLASAAVLALSMYTQLSDASSAGAVSSFRAGDVSVTKRGAGSVRGSAGALRTQAEAMLTGYLEDRDFQFRGVRG